MRQNDRTNQKGNVTGLQRHRKKKEREENCKDKEGPERITTEQNSTKCNRKRKTKEHNTKIAAETDKQRNRNRNRKRNRQQQKHCREFDKTISNE